jgi:16S rRNA (cytosine1407-C5)-methyltransferase
VNVWISLLKKWWVFIYSTCTLSPEENEDIVEYILGFEWMRLNNIDLDFEFKRDWIKEYKDKKYSFDNTKIIRILPSELSEWFFVAKFKKY